MDDGRHSHRRAARPAGIAAVALVACSLTGCSLFVMAGKMLFGDPKVPCAFKQQTQVDLVKDDMKILVVCSTPEAVKSEFSSLSLDLLDGVTRQLKRRNVRMVDPDAVATWLDDNGGVWNDPTELAQQFDADYIVHIDLNHFRFREDGSPTLFRGRTGGTIYAYEVRKVDGHRTAVEVFVSDFNSVHPEHNPLPVEQRSAKTFRKEYVDRISIELARMFYDYRMSETF